ncbi:protein lifeguard 3 [Drosophila eugracilis]|uniref:protein lifeguard 3 n=1 Tax=Drosophila eugracilis TaxID=29029 RepID=UPI001BDA3CD8|nr:protein lifeguard 3 [Drosophila eugracilis]
MACCRPRNRRFEDDSTFADPAVRRRFVTKVLLIVAVNLAITTLAMTTCVMLKPLRHFFQRFWFLSLPAILIIMIMHYMMCCCRNLFRVPVLKWVLLAIYVFCHAILVICLAVRYHPRLVIMAFGICAGLVVFLCLFAWFAPCDFTSCFVLIFIISITLVVLGILAIFFRTFKIVYLAFGVIAYSIYIVVDLQMIVGGRIHKNQYDESDFILGAMSLFHDIIYLFWFILQLCGLIDE